MSIPPINNLSGYLQPLVGQANCTSGSKAVGIDVQLQPDNSQLSPFAQALQQLQQLQQSDPAKYQQVTQQIATNLQSAAQNAQSQGNTTRADHLNQLATDFTNASKTGQPMNPQDFGNALGGHHHHHHHGHAAGQSDSQTLLTMMQNALSSAGANSNSQGDSSTTL